ncbi:MAG TPA: 50S ribosomal protein L10 [Candidatus Gracilibacteria bacterium]
MATSKAKKSGQLTALTEKFKGAQGVAFVNFNLATVEEVQAVRRDLRSKGMSYTVIKKTLMAIAARDAGICEFDSDNLEGSVAVIVSSDDAIAPASAIKDMKKKYSLPKKKIVKFDFAGAIFEGAFLSAAETAILADTPSREESIAKILGALRSGPQKLHGILNSGLQRPYNVLKNADKFATA